MGRAYLSKTVAAGLGQRPSINASDTAAITATNAQIATFNRTADQAVATGQQTLWEAQQTTQNARGGMPASLLPAQTGDRKN